MTPNPYLEALDVIETMRSCQTRVQVAGAPVCVSLSPLSPFPPQSITGGGVGEEVGVGEALSRPCTAAGAQAQSAPSPAHAPHVC